MTCGPSPRWFPPSFPPLSLPQPSHCSSASQNLPLTVSSPPSRLHMIEFFLRRRIHPCRVGADHADNCRASCPALIHPRLHLIVFPPPPHCSIPALYLTITSSRLSYLTFSRSPFCELLLLLVSLSTDLHPAHVIPPSAMLNHLFIHEFALRCSVSNIFLLIIYNIEQYTNSPSTI